MHIVQHNLNCNRQWFISDSRRLFNHQTSTPCNCLSKLRGNRESENLEQTGTPVCAKCALICNCYKANINLHIMLLSLKESWNSNFWKPHTRDFYSSVCAASISGVHVILLPEKQGRPSFNDIVQGFIQGEGGGGATGVMR